MTRVLVTGASGFIGSKLVERLVDRGDDVTCFVQPTSDRTRLEPLGVQFATGDVRDRESLRAAVANCEVVYHLAGLVTAFRARDLMAVNAEGFANLVAACAARTSPPALISVSSLAAAGPSPAERARTESDPPQPVSHYGYAKRAGELVAEQYAARVPITIVRPPIVFGQRDPLMLGLFRSIYRFGIHLAVGVGRSHYSLIHVDDLCDALILCAQRGSRLPAEASAPADGTAGYYFVAGNEQPTFAELGGLIGRSLDRPRVWTLRTAGPALLWPAAALAEVGARLRRQPFIFNFDKAREARAGNWVCSTAAIRRDLGFSPAAPLADRLRQTSDWYRRANWL